MAPAAQVALNRRLAAGGADAARSLDEAMDQAVEIARGFPRLRDRIDMPTADYAAAPEKSFEFGLKAILDGSEGAGEAS